MFILSKTQFEYIFSLASVYFVIAVVIFGITNSGTSLCKVLPLFMHPIGHLSGAIAFYYFSILYISHKKCRHCIELKYYLWIRIKLKHDVHHIEDGVMIKQKLVVENNDDDDDVSNGNYNVKFNESDFVSAASALVLAKNTNKDKQSTNPQFLF